MSLREEFWKYVKSELRLMPLDFLLEESKKSLSAYNETQEYEHLVDHYFDIVSLLLKESDLDDEIIDMIDKDLEILFPKFLN